ncbi:class I SAM-dependent methyltransferase [Patescibacteria group bacterium]|nr:class I SAM-dependent methyltransferase [Patescibacteria group bacterium]
MQESWEKLYKKQKYYGASLEHLPEIVKIFKNANVKRVLDLGCGGGKHLFYLAKNGFEVYGVDLSKEAINTAKKQFRDHKLKGKFIVGSFGKKFPYKNDFFDAVISIRALNQGTDKDINKAVIELTRVLKPGGLVFITVQKAPSPRLALRKARHQVKTINSLPVKMINSVSYVPLVGLEKAVIHYIFTKSLLTKKFKDFKINEFWIEKGKEAWQCYYCFLGRKD